MIKVGVAGLGFMGMVHYLTYEKIRGVKVAAIADENKKRLAGDWRDIKGNFGPAGQKMDLSDVHTYSSVDEMIEDPELDLIDITLPPNMHAEVAIKAMKAGKHVFSEKPMSLNSTDCRRMIRTSKQTSRSLFVGHVLPFFPEYAWALKAVRSGKYGKLLGGSFKRVISDPSWLANYWKADQVGGPMLDLHVHDAHFISLLFGLPTEVSTCGRQRGELAEYWNTQLGFSDPQVTVLATSGVISQQGRSFNHGFEIHLEKGTLLFDFAVMGEKAEYLCPPTILNNKGRCQEAKLSGGDPMDAFVSEIKEVLGCIKKNQESDILGSEHAMQAITLCNKQTQSLLNNRKVKVAT